ncbi:hypothetical protein CANARDRAFT_27511 [[Candida] arabinofermentans NRRL YB-2248]|uniref:Uncharacterized protein n=1 Tax=[Candida] arabinofermentans NRRL YB-2248 TaxID=983967 RepID=A0A1E4T3D2_9ASCO|nr:hypothetical protein CANARDRAFT_27511 [[Candida] arabinofermentans NRRL YB-2248]
MDLSNLSSNLPLSRSIDDDSMDQINKELSNEFKIGARSIAALYRLSNTKNSLVKAKGYLNCLDDLLNILDNDQTITTLDDFKTVLLNKKFEITGHEESNVKSSLNDLPTKPSPSTSTSSPVDVPSSAPVSLPSLPDDSVSRPIVATSSSSTQNSLHSSSSPSLDQSSATDLSQGIPSNYKFDPSSSSATQSPFSFPLSKLPLSIQHNFKYYNSSKLKQHQQQQQQQNHQQQQQNSNSHSLKKLSNLSDTSTSIDFGDILSNSNLHHHQEQLNNGIIDDETVFDDFDDNDEGEIMLVDDHHQLKRRIADNHSSKRFKH